MLSMNGVSYYQAQDVDLCGFCKSKNSYKLAGSVDC